MPKKFALETGLPIRNAPQIAGLDGNQFQFWRKSPSKLITDDLRRAMTALVVGELASFFSGPRLVRANSRTTRRNFPEAPRALVAELRPTARAR
jgi:hypothetical protein